MKFLSTIAVATLLAAFMLQPAFASAPTQSKQLSAILASVEASQPGQISEAELDDGLWEVKVCSQTGCEKLYINPITGKQVRRKATGRDSIPPKNSKKLSGIIRAIEAKAVGHITEVEFDHGVWEINTRLAVDPQTGKVRQ